jgi:hypothetical protein
MDKKEKTLNEIIEKMYLLTLEGYDCYFKGRGDGIVIPIAQTFVIINKK